VKKEYLAFICLWERHFRKKTKLDSLPFRILFPV
jgi:hypothetical protein